MVTCIKAKRGYTKRSEDSAVGATIEKVRLEPAEELLLKKQAFKKIGTEDLRIALDCVRIVQASYQRKINECRESGDGYHAIYYKTKRDRLLRWMQDYTSLAEANTKL